MDKGVNTDLLIDQFLGANTQLSIKNAHQLSISFLYSFAPQRIMSKVLIESVLGQNTGS